MTAAEKALAHFDQLGISYRLVGGEVKLSNARRISAAVLAQARSIKSDIAALLLARQASTNGADQDPPVTDLSFWQGVADQRNASAERRHGTDRYCSCQRIAESQWRDRASGKLFWCCNECIVDPSTIAPPIRLTRTNRITTGERISTKIRRIKRPTETQRLDWWEQPVLGWSNSRLTLHTMATDVTVEIELE